MTDSIDLVQEDSVLLSNGVLRVLDRSSVSEKTTGLSGSSSRGRTCAIICGLQSAQVTCV